MGDQGVAGVKHKIDAVNSRRAFVIDVGSYGGGAEECLPGIVDLV